MGELIDGIWHPGWGGSSKHGAFERPDSVFRDHDIVPAAGRYHLYVQYACPWAHRTLITRALRGLEQAVSVTVLGPKMGADGWPFRPEDPDPLGPSQFLRDVYLRANPRYSGKVTVPVLWDRETGRIVNNESREVMRLLDVAFAPLSNDPVVETLAPPALLPAIERVLDEIYQPINNGVYRAGFAKTQEAYDKAVRTLFEALAHWDRVLADQPFTCGDTLTEADVALFTTCLRFDLVYYSHFKCNVRRLRDHANLWRFVRQLYAIPAIRATCNLDDIKTHYYWSQDNVNPTRIVPAGPDDYAIDLNR
jgi:putative glutathione S-transferase